MTATDMVQRVSWIDLEAADAPVSAKQGSAVKREVCPIKVDQMLDRHFGAPDPSLAA
jgi:hypothetical protein